MKQIQLLFLAIVISLSMANRLAAQDTFSSFDIFNRVILVNYADSIDQDVKRKF